MLACTIVTVACGYDVSHGLQTAVRTNKGEEQDKDHAAVPNAHVLLRHGRGANQGRGIMAKLITCTRLMAGRLTEVVLGG